MLEGSLTSALRAADRGRLLAAQFTPARARGGVLALLAFNAELGAVSWRTREPLAAQVRFQWWRGHLAEICGGRPPKHGLAEALAEASVRHGLTPPALERLIDAREHAALADPPSDLDEMEARARAVDGTLFGLWARMLDAGGGEAVDAAADNLGAAWGLIGAVRAIPAYAAAGRPILSAESAAVRPVCEHALRRLADARAVDVPKAARPAFLAAVLADDYAARLARAGHNPFDARVQAAGAAPGALARLCWKAARGSF